MDDADGCVLCRMFGGIKDMKVFYGIVIIVKINWIVNFNWMVFVAY